MCLSHKYLCCDIILRGGANDPLELLPLKEGCELGCGVENFLLRGNTGAGGG